MVISKIQASFRFAALLFVFIVLHSCCKLITRKSELEIVFDGYNFNAVDSIKVSSYKNTSYVRYYKTNSEGEIKLYLSNYYETFYDETLIISNDRLSILDTLKKIKIEERKISSKCPGINQEILSFEFKNMKYGPDGTVQLVIKR